MTGENDRFDVVRKVLATKGGEEYVTLHETPVAQAVIDEASDILRIWWFWVLNGLPPLPHTRYKGDGFPDNRRITVSCTYYLFPRRARQRPGIRRPSRS